MIEVIKCPHGKIFAACNSNFIDEEWIEEREFYRMNCCKIETIKGYEFKFENIRLCCPSMPMFNHINPDKPIIPNQLKLHFP